MKRILFIIPYLSSGGAERVVSVISSEMAKLGADVHLLVFYRVVSEYPINCKVIMHIMRENKIEYDNLTYIEKLKALRNAIKEIKPDVVLPFIAYVGLMVSVAKIGLNITVVETIRINPRYSPRNKLIRWLRNISVFFSKGCIVQNNSQLEYFPKCVQNRMIVLPNPISEEFIKKEKIFKDKKIKNIIAAGRLEKQKNFHMLISAFSHVAQNNKEINLRIYGEGSQYNVLNDYINKLDLKRKVLLCGRITCMPNVLQKSDLFILSSEAEGMPNSLMEAMAIGLPCISTNCPTGPADLISNGIDGCLIPVGDEKALAAAIDKMINDVDLSIEMGKRARQSVLNRYDSEVCAKKLMKFIDNINQNQKRKKIKGQIIDKRYPKLLLDLFSFIRFTAFKIWPELTLKLKFKRHTGYKLNLNNPRSYNEKLQWLMLYWFDPQATICADKYLVRKFVSERGLGHLLNDLYGVYDKVEDINIDNLPDEFVLKVNHGCGQNIFCDNKSSLNWKLEKKKIKKWLKRNQYYYSLEWGYKDIKPKIIIEKLIKPDNGKVPKDYKVFCFHGEPKYILVVSDRGKGTTKFDFFDIEWNRIDVLNHYPNSKENLLRPEKLDDILEYSKILSNGFPHMRVDFYIEQDKVIFGECTFFHLAGNGTFVPTDFDYEMGRHLDLPEIMKVNHR